MQATVSYNQQSDTLPLLVIAGTGASFLGHNWLEKIVLNWNSIHTVHADQLQAVLTQKISNQNWTRWEILKQKYLWIHQFHHSFVKQDRCLNLWNHWWKENSISWLIKAFWYQHNTQIAQHLLCQSWKQIRNQWESVGTLNKQLTKPKLLTSTLFRRSTIFLQVWQVVRSSPSWIWARPTNSYA